MQSLAGLGDCPSPEFVVHVVPRIDACLDLRYTADPQMATSDLRLVSYPQAIHKIHPLLVAWITGPATDPRLIRKEKSIAPHHEIAQIFQLKKLYQ